MAGELARHLVGGLGADVVLAVAEEKAGQADERRVAVMTPEVDLFGKECLVVVAGGGLDGVVLRGVALDDDARAGSAPPRAAGDLGQQAEGALPGAKIGEVQASIGVDDPDGGDAGEIKALGHHLGADNDIDVASLDLAQQPIRAAGASHRVLVPAEDPRRGKDATHLGFDPLRARAEVVERTAAGGAGATGTLTVIAAMAD